MLLKILLLAFVCMPAPAMVFAAASNASAEIKTQTVEYKQGKAVLEGYFAYDPSIKGKRPGILVVHEWKGLNDYAKHRAEQLAELGYAAFAADIYGKGVRPKTVEEAGKEAGKYKEDRKLLRDRVEAALNALKKQSGVDASRLAAIGYCFGGTTVLELARSGANIKGVVSFHGGLNAGTIKTEKIKPRVLVLHGADDPFVPPTEMAAFQQEMMKSGALYQITSYPNAQHGFTNPDNKGEIKGALYNAEADVQSWAAMLAFFKEIL